MDIQANIHSETVSRNLCIGCGVCAEVCPIGAISLRFDRRLGMSIPRISDNCIHCGLCAKTCVHAVENLASLCTRVSEDAKPELVGLSGAQGYLAWDPHPVRRQSVSGGVVTAIARELLRQGRIAGVIHAERVLARHGEPHYRVVLSRTAAEVEDRRGSAYEPLDFSTILASLAPGETYLAVGTPCVIRNLKALEHAQGGPWPHFITCALVCSHNVTTHFADFMADCAGIGRDTPFLYDPRDKGEIPDSESFNTRFRDENGSDLYKMNRFASGWTKYWRSYAFAPPACCRCPDFWGMEADFSVKDAWGKSVWTIDPLGKSIAIFRNGDILRVAQNSGLEMRELSEGSYAYTQRPQTRFKQVEAKTKSLGSTLSAANVRNGLFRLLALSRITRWTYPRFGKAATVAAFAAMRFPFAVWEFFLSFLNDVRKKFQVQGRTRTILVVGGHGYGNVGDEAQCAATLRLLAERYPSFEIADMSPNPDYSRRVHPGFHHETASRNLFFNHRGSGDIFALDSFRKHMAFLWTMFWIRANASLVKHNLPTLFLNVRKASMLRRLSEASLLYFSGGGYLTGATRSRLWDGALLCRLCHVFHVPVAMSGQTIGVWPNRLDRAIARWGFRHVAVIATRDDEASLADLKGIGFPGKAFPTHDDALFCDKSPERQISHSRYVALNFHFWGMNTDAERAETLGKMHEAISLLRNRYPDNAFVFLPMAPIDMSAFWTYSARFPEDRLEAFEYDYDFRKMRRAIADADLVVTMKHHPIIFAVGENTPVVSLAFSPYYLHKNIGALQQYGAERFGIDLSSRTWLESFRAVLPSGDGLAAYRATLRERKARLAVRKASFLRIVDGLLKAKPAADTDTAFVQSVVDTATARDLQRIPSASQVGTAVYSGEWGIVEKAFPGLEFQRSAEAFPAGTPIDFAFVWGAQTRRVNIPAIEAAVGREASLVLCEDGFLKSADTWANSVAPLKYRRGCSFVMDSRGFYFDATKETDIERMLEDRSLIVPEAERAAARRTIDRIVREKVTKYNHQPVFAPAVGRPGKRKVLVVDQSYGDFSIRRGWADDSTFETMLAEAIAGNPDADVLVKTHPDAMTGTRKGYFDGVVEEGRVFRLTMPVNPYSLVELVDKVYVCSTQFGFEALMAGKEVHVYGMPFYAGWGLTIDKQRNPRRTNRRSLEEVFHIFYNLYTHWVDPETGERWTIDQAIDHLVALRSEYGEFQKRQGGGE